MQYSDEKDQRIKELENQNRILQEKVQLLEHNVEILTQAVCYMQQKSVLEHQVRKILICMDNAFFLVN